LALCVEKSGKRKLSAIGEKIVASAASKSLSDGITAAISDLESIGNREYDESDMTFGESVDAELDEIERLHNGGEVEAVSIGMPTLDKILGGGLRPAQLAIFAGRPGMGKTSFALGIAEHLAARNIGVQFFSLEMSKSEMTLKTLSMMSGVSMVQARNGNVSKEELEALKQAQTIAKHFPINVDDDASIVSKQIYYRSKRYARKLEKEGIKLGLIIVDYIQLMEGKGESREKELAKISRALKLTAKKLHVPVVALAQLNRGVENRDNTHPRLSDIRDSGAIEQDADVVGFTWRDLQGDPSSAKIIIAKNRFGPSPYTVNARFDTTRTKFYERSDWYDKQS
jgi:replicative DNA helicase